MHVDCVLMMARVGPVLISKVEKEEEKEERKGGRQDGRENGPLSPQPTSGRSWRQCLSRSLSSRLDGHMAPCAVLTHAYV